MYGMVWYGRNCMYYTLGLWTFVVWYIYALWVLEMSNTTTDMGDIYADM